MLEYVANDPNDIINTVGNTIYNFSFDSYMKYENELSTGELRLLAVTNPLVLPVKTNIKLYVTSDDVLHS
jgi:heme/copper-type cytochrome/quinol oxidase subunit 2